MKVILAVADYKGKNVLFITDTLRALTLDEAVSLVDVGTLEELGVVRRGNGTYLRTKKNVPKERELATVSLTVMELNAFAQGFSNAVSTASLRRYLQLYQASLVDEHEFIKPARNLFKVPVVSVRDVLVSHRVNILLAAEHFVVDPFLLGAILIDEIAAMQPFEIMLENISAKEFGRNTSVGVAQVKIDTANNLIRKGLYNPNSKDINIPFKRMNSTSRLHLAPYVIDPKHNVFFAAALIRSFVDDWQKFVDLASKPEIIATLYHIGYKKPHGSPQPDKRGEQIAGEFYSLAKIWLRK